MKLLSVTLLLACLSACTTAGKLASCDGTSKRPINKPQQSSAASFANCT